MPKIICGSLNCRYNNNRCECTFKGTLSLSECYVSTKHMGYQTFHECSEYKESDIFREKSGENFEKLIEMKVTARYD